MCCIRNDREPFYSFILFYSFFFIVYVSVCLVMNFLPLICSDTHLSPWLDEIELPNRRICDVHFRLTLAFSFSFFSLAGRKEKHASRNERRRKYKLFFFVSHPAFFFHLLLLYFCLHPFADTHRKISSLFFFIPSSSLYLDDERVWIRSGRVYGTSISGLVNEAEIRQPSPNDEVKSKGFFIYTQQRERLSLVKQRERVYRKGQYKTRRR